MSNVWKEIVAHSIDTTQGFTRTLLSLAISISEPFLLLVLEPFNGVRCTLLEDLCFSRKCHSFPTCALQADVSVIDCDQTLGKSGQLLLDLRRNTRVAVVQTQIPVAILFDLGSLWERKPLGNWYATSAYGAFKRTSWTGKSVQMKRNT